MSKNAPKNPKDAGGGAKRIETDGESKTIAQNRRARFDYFITETLETGIVLTGTEVKSMRMGGVSINETYAGVHEGELYIFNAHIPELKGAGKWLQHDIRRPRKLLVSKRDMARLMGAVQRKGVTLVPIALYFNKRGLIKLSLGLATGKKQQDKRETIKERDWNRQKSRLMKDN